MILVNTALKMWAKTEEKSLPSKRLPASQNRFFSCFPVWLVTFNMTAIVTASSLEVLRRRNMKTNYC
jgi:hypothetical protein